MTDQPKTIWKLPVSCSLLVREPKLTKGLRRRYTLSLEWENEDADRDGKAELRFEGVESYRVTHLWSLTIEMLEPGFGELVELPPSDWLRRSMDVRLGRPPGVVLRHFRMCFDDGPCYEFLCTDCQVEIDQT